MSIPSSAMRRIRPIASRLSPARRRWIRFLRGLSLDPDSLERPIAAPGPHDFVICGSPRTGTTLACAALFQPPSVVTVMEPWDGMRLPPAELFAALRAEIGTGVLRRGRLDVDGLRRDGATKWRPEGESEVELPPMQDYLLGVKWPAYWRYLDLLPETRFIVCLRHPLEVVSSYKMAGGRVGQGLQYDTAFNRELNTALGTATTDAALRRVLLFDYVHERLLPHLDRPNVLTVRYERWFQDLAGLLEDVSTFLGTELTSVPVRLRPPKSRSSLTDEEVELLQRRCRTADALGYPLDQWPRYDQEPA